MNCGQKCKVQAMVVPTVLSSFFVYPGFCISVLSCNHPFFFFLSQEMNDLVTIVFYCIWLTSYSSHHAAASSDCHTSITPSHSQLSYPSSNHYALADCQLCTESKEITPSLQRSSDESSTTKNNWLKYFKG